jgi:predicted nucleotidyltransferase
MLEEYSIIKIIQELLSHPVKVYTLRELAKSSDSSKDSVAKALDFMLERGMVSLKVVGPTHQYQADLESTLTRQWKVLFNLEELTQAKLVEEIKSKIPTVQSVLVYGSLAKGINDENSDLDLLVIAGQKSAQKPVLGKSLKREINPLLINMKEWKSMAEKDKVFYDNVVLDSIVLFGKKPVVL